MHRRRVLRLQSKSARKGLLRRLGVELVGRLGQRLSQLGLDSRESGRRVNLIPKVLRLNRVAAKDAKARLEQLLLRVAVKVQGRLRRMALKHRRLRLGGLVEEHCAGEEGIGTRDALGGAEPEVGGLVVRGKGSRGVAKL